MWRAAGKDYLAKRAEAEQLGLDLSLVDPSMKDPVLFKTVRVSNQLSLKVNAYAAEHDLPDKKSAHLAFSWLLERDKNVIDEEWARERLRVATQRQKDQIKKALATVLGSSLGYHGNTKVGLREFLYENFESMIASGKTIMDVAEKACDIGLVNFNDLEAVGRYCSRLGLRVKDVTTRSS